MKLEDALIEVVGLLSDADYRLTGLHLQPGLLVMIHATNGQHLIRVRVAVERCKSYRPDPRKGDFQVLVNRPGGMLTFEDWALARTVSVGVSDA